MSRDDWNYFKHLAVASLVIGLLRPSFARAESLGQVFPALQDIRLDAVEGKLMVEFRYSKPFDGRSDFTPFLVLDRFKPSRGAETTQWEGGTNCVRGSSLTFEIPPDELANYESVRAHALAKDTNGATIQESVSVSMAKAMLQELTLRKVELAAANDRIKALEDITNKLCLQLTNLQTRLSPLLGMEQQIEAKKNPDILSFEDHWESDDRALFKLRTSSEGIVRATLSGTGAAGHVSITQFSQKLDIDHWFTFKPLEPGRSYTLEAVIVDKDDHNKPVEGPHTRLTNEGIAVVESEVLKQPQLILVTNSDSTIEVKLDLVGGQGVTKFSCWKFEDLGSDSAKAVESTADIELDRLDNPTGQVVANSNYRFTKLESGTKYKIFAKALNRFGKPFPEASIICSTDISRPPLEFAGVVQIEINPLDFGVKWKPNRDDSTGTLEVQFDEGGNQSPVFVSRKAQLTNGLMQAKLDITGLQTVLQKKLTNAAPATAAQPIVNLVMTDGKGNQKKLGFEFQFTLPDKKTLAQSQLSPAQKASVAQISAAAADYASNAGTPTKIKKQFSWQDFATTGLGILSKLAW